MTRTRWNKYMYNMCTERERQNTHLQSHNWQTEQNWKKNWSCKNYQKICLLIFHFYHFYRSGLNVTWKSLVKILDHEWIREWPYCKMTNSWSAGISTMWPANPNMLDWLSVAWSEIVKLKTTQTVSYPKQPKLFVLHTNKILLSAAN
jgi:hypothetical protein